LNCPLSVSQNRGADVVSPPLRSVVLGRRSNCG
jgi:hypothetical protein